ncbi:MAG TPA: polysulfide reductase NrfD [Spirochaetota bacterium]|nr:polysulfide reductase NrfD [Spirochaetota bacterium]HNT11807.1 polysulfide reductase NrfD [Spirochaetota bacterium]HNV48012.1 polysulfide reductase NrfD [Spirochaetota bacterium]HPU88820.1 polysulfide reductase NrfD [Spirochaetota bacterium]
MEILNQIKDEWNAAKTACLNGITGAMKFCKDEWNGYTRNIKITLLVLFGLVGLFIIFGIQILGWGLGYTDMSNLYPFGQWIIGDLGLVGLGGGAFTMGFFLYILRVDKLKPLINSTVLIGFMCYLFTLVFLVFDIGQPLRAWFGYAYPNWGHGLMPQSMLTEVVWCLTFYFCVLIIELVPLPLEHPVLQKFPFIHGLTHYMHKLMWIMAAAGTFLSFFHQGSLGGGMWGVLYGKVVWYRPAYFFTAIVAATAGGTAFMALCAYIAGKVMKKEVVPWDSFQTLAQISGVLTIFAFLFQAWHVYMQATHFVPAFDRSFLDIWGGYYGIWMVVLMFAAYIGAIVLLNVGALRSQERFFVAGISCGVGAISFDKMIVVLHGSSTPNFPWKSFAGYNPTIQEWGIFLGGLATMILIYMLFAKYFPLFPHLNKHGHGEEHAH